VGLAEQIGLGAGSEVSLSTKDGELVVKPAIPARFNLNELLTGIRADNLHSSVDTGDVVGPTRVSRRTPLIAKNRLPGPLRCCLLSGGQSKRMGCDKALLKNPAGHPWLERNLDLLATAGAPITLISGHPNHLRLGEAWGLIHRWSLHLLDEPEPREGPLLALERLMVAHPDDYLFVAPVDLPNLEPTSLQKLLGEAAAEPQTITLATDGSQLQPLLGVYPPSAQLRHSLGQSLGTGNRSLKGWLATVVHRSIPLPTDQLININSPADLQALTPFGNPPD